MKLSLVTETLGFQKRKKKKKKLAFKVMVDLHEPSIVLVIGFSDLTEYVQVGPLALRYQLIGKFNK